MAPHCCRQSMLWRFHARHALQPRLAGTRVRARDMNGGEVLTVLFSVLMGGFSLGQAAPLLQHFISGKTAGARVWSVIEVHGLLGVLLPA